jgi:hypothetical protein
MEGIIEQWEQVSEAYDFVELYLQKLHTEPAPEQRKELAANAIEPAEKMIIALVRLMREIEKQR